MIDGMAAVRVTLGHCSPKRLERQRQHHRQRLSLRRREESCRAIDSTATAASASEFTVFSGQLPGLGHTRRRRQTPCSHRCRTGSARSICNSRGHSGDLVSALQSGTVRRSSSSSSPRRCRPSRPKLTQSAQALRGERAGIATPRTDSTSTPIKLSSSTSHHHHHGAAR